jgi:hypothetical protein
LDADLLLAPCTHTVTCISCAYPHALDASSRNFFFCATPTVCQVCLVDGQHFGDAALCEDCPEPGGRVAIGFAVCFAVLLAVVVVTFLLHYDGHAPRLGAVARVVRRRWHHVKSFCEHIGALSKTKVECTVHTKVLAVTDVVPLTSVPPAPAHR